MNDLLKKLNTLIKAGINDVLDEVGEAASPKRFIPKSRLGTGVESEVNQLRQQINRALDYEDELQARMSQLNDEIDQLDREADAALENGDEVQARYLLERLQRAKQRRTMTESDLNEHRIATQELILRVNELDAVISEAQYAESQQPPSDELPVETAEPLTKPPVQAQAPTPKPVEAVPPSQRDQAQDMVEQARQFSEQTGKMLVDVLREAREKINQMDDLIDAQHEVTSSSAGQTQDAVNVEIEKSAIDDDIAARRSRLAGPAQKKPKTPNDSGE